jgi:hypothetical protein
MALLQGIKKRFGPLLDDQSPNFKTFKDPKNRFLGTNSARLCTIAGQYDNSIPTLFLAPIDCLKIPALDCQLDTAFHPIFCLMWLQKHDPDRVSANKEAMELHVEAGE